MIYMICIQFNNIHISDYVDSQISWLFSFMSQDDSAVYNFIIVT